MAPNPTAAPILFDRALLRARQDRARRGGPATFLLDRVAEDMAERLHAVLREFADAADIWTPGEIVAKAVDAIVSSRVAPICLDEAGARGSSRCSRNRSISRFPRWPFSSSTICPACWRRSAAR